MNKKSILFKIAAVMLLIVMVVSLAACAGFGGNSGGGSGSGGSGSKTEKDKDKDKTKTNDFLTKDAITILKDLDDYSKPGAYNATSKNYDNKVYDSKPCETQYNKLQRRIEIKTEDVYLGKTESSITKIFTKSTADGILNAIAKAALTFDEMVRVVDYLAGDVDATPPDIDSFVKENTLSKSWTGKLTGNTSNITLWVNAGTGGEDLNKGWSFFDDWDLYDRLKDYSKSAYNGLSESREKVLNDVGTKELAEDNASWQYRSILEKIYKPAAQGGVDLEGSAAARLATYMLDYATEVCKGMTGSSNSGIDDAYKNGNTSAFSTLFRTKVDMPANIPDTYEAARVFWDPYRGLGDYDTLSYLLGFYEFYKVRGYNNMPGMQSCAQLYGFYYQYNRTYYNVVLANRETYTKQLAYEKRDTFTDPEWLEYVQIQRNNYEGSYRYKDSFYQVFYKIHFDFQSRKETAERTVYVIDNVTPYTYTGEMQEAIKETKNGIKGQLAMSDWMWCYGSSDQAMKDYNTANTGYQTGKLGDAEAEYRGRFYYEFEQLKIAEFLLNKMTNNELSGALYYNCYGYSGSLISEMQGYSKNWTLINDGIKGWDKFVNIPDNINESSKDEYAKGKIVVLRDDQALVAWSSKEIHGKDGQAELASTQPWGAMRGELSAAREYDYMALTEESTGEYTNVWRKRCDYLEDRVIAREYSCCHQRISQATDKCPTDHGENPDGTAMTKDYMTTCSISKFVSDYENVLYYVAGKVKVDFKTPDKKTGNTYKTSENKEATFVAGYTGSLKDLVSETNKIAYKSAKSMTMKIGATFQKEIINKDGDDSDWWTRATTKSADNTVTKYGPVSVVEKYNNSPFNYDYTYTYSNWYLDEKCRYEFMPSDDVDFNLNIYCGYDVKKVNTNN